VIRPDRSGVAGWGALRAPFEDRRYGDVALAHEFGHGHDRGSGVDKKVFWFFSSEKNNFTHLG
jgi:hypothetical protein